jgi:hypothetical protein
MTTTTEAPTATRRVHTGSPASLWSRTGRAGAALTLLASGALWFVADVIGFGHDDELAYGVAHPTLAGIGITADMLAVPFLFGSLLVWLLLSRTASRRLAAIGAGLLVLGFTGQAMINGVGMLGYGIARSHRIDIGTYSDVINNHLSGLPVTVFMAMFFLGAFLGIVIAMIALWRSRAVPRTAIALLLGFQVVQATGVPFPATGIALVGLAWMAVAILRTRPVPGDTLPVPA